MQMAPEAVIQVWRDRDGSVRVQLLDCSAWVSRPGSVYPIAALTLTMKQAATLHRYLGETLTAATPKEA